MCIFAYSLLFFYQSIEKTFFGWDLDLYLSQGILYFLLPEFNVYRSYDLDMNASEFQSRLLYYEDGISMIRQRLRGYGYMGYYYTQRFFSNRSNLSCALHSFFCFTGKFRLWNSCRGTFHWTARILSE